MKPYPGNKSLTSLYPNIIGLFPPHKYYIELFAGSAQILRKKKPAMFSTVVEIDFNLTAGKKDIYPAGTLVVNDCAISFLSTLATAGADTLIYLDPPYRISERFCQGNIYRHELTDNQHAELLLKLRELSCNVVISHYNSPFYDDLLHGWNKKIIRVKYHSRIAEEAIYYNFTRGQTAETTFSGSNKTDRQRIKRKAQRWADNFAALPAWEQQVILEKINRE